MSLTDPSTMLGPDFFRRPPKRLLHLGGGLVLLGVVVSFGLTLGALRCAAESQPQEQHQIPTPGQTVPGISVPTLFYLAKPVDFSPAQVLSFASRKLTRAQSRLLADPLAASPEIVSWARRITIGATNDMQRAEALYQVVAAHGLAGAVHGRRYRTAREVFNDWNKPGEPFLCPELAYLYVALARAVNLPTYTVLVEEDCFGKMNFHACAASFFDDRALLVDPTYTMFGPSHKRFTVLDDVRALALFLSGMVDEPGACEAAAKLAPDLSVVQVALFDRLTGQRRWKAARAQLDKMTRYAPEAPMTYYAKGVMAYHEGKPREAIEFLAEGIRLAPETAQICAMLGYVYVSQGNLARARECYQDAYRYALDQRSAEAAQRTLHQIEQHAIQTNSTN